MTPGAFAALPPQALDQLRAVARTGRWGRGGLLFHPEDPAEVLYLLTRGSVRLYSLGAGAREVTLVVHLEGELVGVQALRPGQLYGRYAECADDTEALMFSRETLERLLRDSPEISQALTEQIVAQTAALQGRLAGLVFHEVSQRLARTLLDFAERQGEWDGKQPFALQDRLSHQELAHIVGSTRETITKLLGEFRNRGLLDLGYRRIVLTDREGLLEAGREPLR
ncbi:transcriptional regulator, Crp/Fnr family [Deinococcus proteolyticus MRP]|uniref:Transcriptional regulator, Crp/Fnr family n=1 Tax=Deinococcus proteolyticus (strain ATCC 35074 / DSM 20540 / JCM 6276 / NBRC 101906 / NCIMB 13154 / VKM Ac-1939 / CCM 2703 / MRP) TaxID=693977 RepID=F0RJE4_DEIPM|nr:Crp/Fnr family transcriptional regulator [Deinococcus proteolyticus]ADY25485.1 transcriptional regulator, Crp/Fnr family [Deinococcus proteolyticus MRP]